MESRNDIHCYYTTSSFGLCCNIRYRWHSLSLNRCNYTIDRNYDLPLLKELCTLGWRTSETATDKRSEPYPSRENIVEFPQGIASKEIFFFFFYGKGCYLGCCNERQISCQKSSQSGILSFVTNDPHDHLYKISNWMQCIMGRPKCLLWFPSFWGSHQTKDGESLNHMSELLDLAIKNSHSQIAGSQSIYVLLQGNFECII